MQERYRSSAHCLGVMVLRTRADVLLGVNLARRRQQFNNNYVT